MSRQARCLSQITTGTWAFEPNPSRHRETPARTRFAGQFKENLSLITTLPSISKQTFTGKQYSALSQTSYSWKQTWIFRETKKPSRQKDQKDQKDGFTHQLWRVNSGVMHPIVLHGTKLDWRAKGVLIESLNLDGKTHLVNRFGVFSKVSTACYFQHTLTAREIADSCDLYNCAARNSTSHRNHTRSLM